MVVSDRSAELNAAGALVGRINKSAVRSVSIRELANLVGRSEADVQSANRGARDEGAVRAENARDPIGVALGDRYGDRAGRLHQFGVEQIPNLFGLGGDLRIAAADFGHVGDLRLRDRDEKKRKSEYVLHGYSQLNVFQSRRIFAIDVPPERGVKSRSVRESAWTLGEPEIVSRSVWSLGILNRSNGGTGGVLFPHRKFDRIAH